MIRRRTGNGEAGFTLVESLVATLLVSLGSLAVLSMFDTSRRATLRAEQSQVAVQIAEQEVEKLRALGYSELALTVAPATASDPADPRSRVSGTTFDLRREGGEPAELVVEGGALHGGGTVTGATVDPGPTPFTSGDVSGEVFRFITWRDDPSCLAVLVCPGEQDLKRIAVIVRLDSSPAGGSRSYIEMQSDAIDPTDSLLSDADLPELGDPVVAQQFWLSDERCTNTGEPAHSASLSSHATHPTLGHDCRTTTSGRPDALVTTPPTNLNDTLDFATDLEPTPPDADAGLQLSLGSSNGCKFKPTGSDGFRESHIWVTRKLPLDFAMTGGATLELWTRAINDVTTHGTICVVLFTRLEDPLGVLPPTDVRMLDLDNPANDFYTHELSDWPRGSWGRIRIPLRFTPTTAPLGQRLGIAVSLDKQHTPSDQVMFQYDQVQLESRLEVETTTPLLP